MARKKERHASQGIAARMKELGVCRTTGRCANCYQIITIDSRKSKYRHVCH